MNVTDPHRKESFEDYNKQQNGKWHLTVRLDIRMHTDESKVTRRLKEEKSKLSFMQKLIISLFDTFLCGINLQRSVIYKIGSIVGPHVMCGQGSWYFHHPTTTNSVFSLAEWNKFYLKIFGRHIRTKICAERHKYTLWHPARHRRHTYITNMNDFILKQ